MRNLKQKSRYVLIMLSFILMNALNVHAQTKAVSGTVKDNAGEPIIGATVTVFGQPKIGTVTDIDGNFKLEVPDNSRKIEVSYIGMSTQQVDIKGTTPLRVTLKDDTKDLDEIVVIGYGAVKNVI